ncbi:MAG: MOSC N-terminal beta barrel domain-containing protein [Streptosporangiaceae bacterium]
MGGIIAARAGGPVGVVARLWRYPVKSMAAEAITSAYVSWAGLAGDRKWAFVRPASSHNGFPWLTIRDNPAMSGCVPTLLDPERPDKSAVQVRAPGGKTYGLADPGLAEELGAGARLMRLDRGAFDAMPVSLISTGTVSALCALAEVPGNELRFRPNLVIAPTAGAPYAEDEWVGRALQIGEAIVRIDRRDTRCVIVNVDPGAGRPDAALLQVIGRHRGACAGVYGSTVRPGLVQAGDLVTIAA